MKAEPEVNEENEDQEDEEEEDHDGVAVGEGVQDGVNGEEGGI